jgi:hypothetical protein
MLATKRGVSVVKHWDVSRLTRKCLGKLERRGRHYVGHGERSPSATSARAPGFDYGEDFEIFGHLSYNAARHQESEVAGQVFKYPKNCSLFYFILFYFMFCIIHGLVRFQFQYLTNVQFSYFHVLSVIIKKTLE